MLYDMDMVCVSSYRPKKILSEVFTFLVLDVVTLYETIVIELGGFP